MTTNYDIDDFSSVDEDLMLSDNSGYESSGGGGGFWSLKENSTMTVYFLSDPWTKDVDHGWWIWREVSAWEGLKGDIELPGGYKTFPVRDQKVVEINGQRRRQDINLDGPEGDELLKMVKPYLPRGETKRTMPYRPVKDAIGANIVELSPDGTPYPPKVIVFTKTRYSKFLEKVNLAKAMTRGGGFTLVGQPWLLQVTGKGMGEAVNLIPLLDQPPLENVPELIDIPEALRQKRQALYDIIQSSTGISTATYAAEDADAAEPMEAGEISAPAEPVALTDAEAREALYATWTPARFRTLLKKKGVTVDPAADLDELKELARQYAI
jgi:hypothetical protein